MRVKVAVILRNADFNLASRCNIRVFEFRCFIIAFGTPADIMGVTESVDVENVDVGRGEKEILNELLEDQIGMLLRI